METIIHNVEKIEIGELRKLGLVSYTRDIYITSNDEKLRINCFGKKEDLQIEVTETKKV